jgi:hypothetical protein
MGPAPFLGEKLEEINSIDVQSQLIPKLNQLPVRPVNPLILSNAMISQYR